MGVPSVVVVELAVLEKFVTKFYNSLESEIINTNSIYSFKKTLKNKIINNYE